MKASKNCSQKNGNKFFKILEKLFVFINIYLSNLFKKIFTAFQVIFYSLIFSHSTLISYAHAGPSGGTVVGGSGSINQSGISTIINQTTGNMAINWNSYNLSANERVQYIQPDSSSISLNRILSNSGSQIMNTIPGIHPSGQAEPVKIYSR